MDADKVKKARDRIKYMHTKVLNDALKHGYLDKEEEEEEQLLKKRHSRSGKKPWVDSMLRWMGFTEKQILWIPTIFLLVVILIIFILETRYSSCHPPLY